jgi:hypothetical protein
MTAHDHLIEAAAVLDARFNQLPPLDYEDLRPSSTNSVDIRTLAHVLGLLITYLAQKELQPESNPT